MHRWDKALKEFPYIKKTGLTVCDYNCTWYVNAEKVENKLKELYDTIHKYQKLTLDQELRIVELEFK